MTAKENHTILVTIRLLGFLRKWRNDENSQVKVTAGITIYDLVDRFLVRNAEDFRSALLDRSGHLNGGLELILNGQVVSPSQIHNVEILENSELIIIPVIAGGG